MTTWRCFSLSGRLGVPARSRPIIVLAVLGAGLLAPAVALAAGAKDTASEVVLEGSLAVLVEDFPGQASTRHVLETASGRIEVRIAYGTAPGRVRAGKVKVRGKRLGGVLEVTDPATNIAYLAPSAGDGSGGSASVLGNPLGEQKTLVMLVNFQDKPIEQPFTVGEVNQAVFGTASDYFGENSYGQTWLAGETVGWTTISMSSTSCDQLGIASEAKSAASKAGFDVSSYSRLVYLFPRNTTCGWVGTSTVGGKPSQAWINGSIDLGVVGHELGHSLGLEHSLSLSCNGTILGPSCTTLEYGDGVDVMGWSPQAHVNAYQKEKLGWLGAGASPPLLTVESSGTYQVASLEPAGSTPRALKILKSIDPTYGWKTWYYVELREAVGFDSVLTSENSMMDESNLLGGVVVHAGPDLYRNTSHLLDMTPETYDLYTRDPALPVGRSFSDPQAGVSIHVESISGSTATVRIALDSLETVAPAATLDVSVSTSRATYTRGQLVPISAAISRQGAAVGGASVTLTITKPSGVVVKQSATSDSQGVASYSLRVKKNDPLGAYSVRAEAAKDSLTGSASASFTVQ